MNVILSSFCPVYEQQRCSKRRVGCCKQMNLFVRNILHFLDDGQMNVFRNIGKLVSSTHAIILAERIFMYVFVNVGSNLLLVHISLNERRLLTA